MDAIALALASQPRRVSLRNLNLTTTFIFKNCILCHSSEIFSNGDTVDGFEIQLHVPGSSQREK